LKASVIDPIFKWFYAFRGVTMMGKVTKNDLFRDYYFNNKGTLYKSFDININNFHHSYDIYWGNPDIIFNNDGYTIYHPLAVTQIPQRKNYPNQRIFLHEKFDKKIHPYLKWL
jgi:hypothetical protein